MSSVTCKRRVSYSIDHDGHTFDLLHEPVDSTVSVTFKNRKREAIVRYLVYDADTRDDYFKEYDQGQFYCADPRNMWYHPLSDEDIETLRKDNPGRVFFISKYEHSLVRYYRSGTAMHECRWDTSKGYAIHVVPEDATNPEEYCDAVMKELTDWCNGNIYGCVVERFKRVSGEWERVSDDACWGFIGYEYAMKELEGFEG